MNEFLSNIAQMLSGTTATVQRPAQRRWDSRTGNAPAPVNGTSAKGSTPKG